MGESDFRPRWIYWAAVRLFGWLARRSTAWYRGTAGAGHRVTDLAPNAID